MRLSGIQRWITVVSYAIALVGAVPLFPYLGTAPRLVLAASFCLGIWWDRRGAWPVKPWLLNSAAVLSLVWYAAEFSRSNPAQPVVNALTILLSVRLLSEKNPRHYQQIYALALFCLASSSLFDLSPLFLLWLTAMTLLVPLALVLVTFQGQDRRIILSSTVLRRVAVVGLALPLLTLPLMVVFFPILPRTQTPLWNFLSPPSGNASGFSEKVAPGSSPEVGAGKGLAFRVETGRIPVQQLYWRGAVFNRVDGNVWSRKGTVPPELGRPQPASRHQTVYMEPHLSRYLIGLDLPLKFIPFRGRRSNDNTFELRSPPPRRISYEVDSAPTGVIPVAGGISRNFYLQLPPDLSQSIRELGREIHGRGGDSAGKIEALTAYFRNGEFVYTRTGLPTGKDSVERFLFEKRAGHCEFFASSFALLLRTAGVPTRLVGGYLGGEYNDLGGYYLVSEDMAHVWVEAYVENEGWRRIDPSSFAKNAASLFVVRNERSMAARFRLTLDSLNHLWNRGVINYDFERQMEFARGVNLRLQGVDARDLWRKAVMVGVAIAAGAVTYWYRRGAGFRLASREERLLRRFVSRLDQDRGESHDPSGEGLIALSNRIGDPRVTRFVRIYASAVYNDRPLTQEEYQRLRRIIRDGFAFKG